MNSTNKTIVTNFIEEIWNLNHFEKIADYVAVDFEDHSLPPTLPPNQAGTKMWIMETGKAFEHQTIVEKMVGEEDKVMLKIRMDLKHIGTWRNIEPTLSDISVVGYRYFELADGKITSHWSLLDGNSIENQLKSCQHGCKIQE